jgi:hypothetical protein
MNGAGLLRQSFGGSNAESFQYGFKLLSSCGRQRRRKEREEIVERIKIVRGEERRKENFVEKSGGERAIERERERERERKGEEGGEGESEQYREM